MPAKNNSKLLINLDLLKPQSNPEKLPLKLLRWLLSSGRFMFIFVEALVLIAFIARFKLDADLASRKEDIEQQAAFIESSKSYEILIRQTQAKLASIKAFYDSEPSYTQILKKIADQTPKDVKVASLSFVKDVSGVNISIIGEAKNNSDISSFIQGLKEGQFSGVNLTSIGLEQGVIRFTLTLTHPKTSQQKSL